MPDWMQRITLVLNMHGMHWTGYIFNTYADMLAILQWVDRRIRGERVLVYLPAWDGRYYWNYPEYRPDERMGGVQGLKRLIDGAHAMGYKIMPMFGATAINRRHPEYSRLSRSIFRLPEGQIVSAHLADWDADRDYSESWVPLNLGH